MSPCISTIQEIDATMGFIQEFKEFALKGNVVDLAVGVIIGGAFGKIITSVVSDVFMPLISLVTGGISFASMKLVLATGLMGADGKPMDPATINYGQFIQNVFDFAIVALVLFMVIKAMNRLKKETPVAAPETPAEEKLLAEIRDLLKARA
jgi:large conductance mechanosensitive channel